MTSDIRLPDEVAAFADRALRESIGWLIGGRRDFQINAVAARVRLRYPETIDDWPPGVLEHDLAHRQVALLKQLAAESKRTLPERLKAAEAILNDHVVNDLVAAGTRPEDGAGVPDEMKGPLTNTPVEEDE